MSIARGARSILNYKPESVFGTAPSGNWITFPVNSETFDENINTVQGEDIRSDRANPGMRGGNISTGGNLVCDYGPVRHLTLLKHLLAGAWSVVPLTVNLPDAVDSAAYIVGQWVKGSASSYWVCTTAGTASTGLVAALTGTSPVTSGTAVFTPRKGASAAADSTAYALGDIVTSANGFRWICTDAGTTSTDVATALAAISNVANPVTSGDAAFSYLCGELRPSTVYSRGHVVMDATNRYWICTRGGTTGALVVKGDLGSGTGEVEITGIGGTIVKFQYAGASTTTLYRHTITPGNDWPTGGLTFEKAILGGNTAAYIQFLGCRVNSMELSIPQEGIVKSTWNMLAKSSAKKVASGAGTPVLSGEQPYTGFNCYVGMNETVGNADRSVREFSMTITNNADESAYIVGSRFRAEIPEGIRRASGRLSMYFLDAQEYDWFKNENTISIMASFIWEGRMVSFNFGEAKLTGSGTPKISGSGLLQADYEWTAFLVDGAYDVSVTAINTVGVLPA